MATVQKTFAFASDAEGLTGNGAGSQPIFAFEGTDGDPAGSFKWTQGSKNQNQSAQATGPTDGSVTWESWGVPAAATVNNVRVVSYRTRLAANTKLTSHDWRIQIVNSGGSVHGATALANQTGGTSTGFWGAGSGIAAAQNVDAGSQASSSTVALQHDYHVVTSGGGGSANVDQRFDTITIEIDYTAGSEQHSGSGTLSLVPSFTHDVTKIGQGAGNLAAVAGLASAGTKTASGGGSLVLVPSLAASGGPVGGVVEGDGTLVLVPSFALDGDKIGSGAGSLSLVPTLNVAASKRAVGAGVLGLAPSFPVAGFKTVGGIGSLALTAQLSGSGQPLGGEPTIPKYYRSQLLMTR